MNTFDSADVTVGGITYLNNYATPLTITTAVGTYDAGTAGAGADDVFIRRNTATPTSTANVAGQAVSILSSASGGTTVYGTYNATMKDLLLGGNVLNSTWDTFANTSSGAGNVGHNIERIDFVWSNGYTVVGDEVLIVFNFDPVGAQDDFRVAVFTGIDNSANKLPTAYANTGVLVTGTSYPDKLPLPLSGNPITSTSTGFRTTATDNLSGTALNIGDSQTVGIGGVAISLTSLGITAGQTIFGYSLLSADTNVSTAASLIDFTNSSIYPTSTPNADASGTADFSTFGGKIATIQTTSIGSAAYEWSGNAGTTKWGSTAGGESNTNWYSPVPAETNRTPFKNADVIFGGIPSTNQLVDLDNNVAVRSMKFDGRANYTIGTAGDTPTITLGDPNLAGSPSVVVTNTNGDYKQYAINSNVILAEDLAITNNSNSSICFDGTITTNSTVFPSGSDMTVTGTGSVNFDGAISGSGNLTVNTSAIATLNANNSTSVWIGNVDVQAGQLVVTADGALGGSVSRTNDLARTTGNTSLQIANANAADLKVGQLVTGTNIPAGTYITGISAGVSETTITLSNLLTGPVSNTASITFAGATTVENGASLTIRPSTTGTPLNYTATETITLNGNGVWNGPGRAGALYNDGGNNTLGANVSLRLGTNSSVGSRDGNLTINGVISEATSGLSLTKFGEGVVTLNAANTYTGATIVANGALRTTNASAISTSSNLQLSGGVLELGVDMNGGTAGDYSAALGTAGGQVRFTGDGGFSAYGAARTVNIGGGTALTWNSTTNFLSTGQALLLSSNFSDNTITFQNAIDLNSGQREIRVANGSAAIDAVLSGNLTGTGGGIIKTGAGTLNLTGTNTYTGATEIKAGSLRGNVSTSSNLQLNGGVRDVSANTAITLGTGAGNVQWTGDGGFAAVGGARTLNLSAGASLVWGGPAPTSGFVAAGNKLIFGSTGADNTLTLTNALALSTSGTRTIQTIAGTSSLATTATGAISGIVSGAANLAVTGNGRLDLTANNTHTGAVTIGGSELRLSGANGDLAQSSGFTIRQGGELTLDNGAAVNSNAGGRVGDSATVALNGGILSYYGQTANASTAETIGVLSLTGGGNTVDIVNNAAGRNTTLTASSLSRSAGATVDFTNSTTTNGTYGTGNTPRLTFGTTAPTLANGILAYATVNGADFATLSGSSIVAQTTYTTGAQTGWTGTVNAAPSSDANALLSAARSVNSLKLGSGIDVVQAGFTLTVASGGILTTGGTAATISGGSLTTGNSNELIVHAYNTGGTTISSTLTGTGGLTKSGTGTLTLSGTTANTLTGTTTVNDGTLILAKSAGTTALAGNITVGDGRGTDVLQINANEQIANTANVTLNGNTDGGTGETKLVLNGSTSAGVTETFASLSITGTAVIDFAGGDVCSPNYLFLSALNIPSDGKLLVRNWNEFTDFLMVDSAFNVDSVLDRIEFEGYADKTYSTTYGTGWNQIRPVPEPSTYGLMMLGGGIAFYGFRRWRGSKGKLKPQS